MKAYENKEKLKEAIYQTYTKFDKEFDEVPEALKDEFANGIDRTPAQILAYQVGWTTCLLQWENLEREGKKAITPDEGYKWNKLGDLYENFNEKYSTFSLKMLRKQLRKNVELIYNMLDTMSEEEVFLPHQRKWADEATSKAAWEVYKFIHINTVAPFTNFRAKLRKYKKIKL